MMTKFHLEEMKISKTLLAKISRINEKAKHENSISQRVYVFQQRVKSLNFAAIIFRLDIVFVSRDVTTHNTEDCENRVLMIERSQK